VLEVDSTNRSQFSDSDLAFLQTLANSLAVAIRAQKREDGKAEMLREKEVLLLENERLLREKDLLFKEIHHRVTNSLQLVHSALSIQLRALRDSEARGQVAEAAARVLAIAAVHGRHYQRALLDDMKLLMPESGDRRLDLEMKSFPLSADQLAHLGLIVVELVTNALKHGRGRINVDVRRDGDALAIAVSDEGPSFPPTFDPATGGGLGLKIVSSLAGPAGAEAIAVDRSVPFGRIVVRMAL
jgi:two-component sensor histidine kinase